MEQDEDGDVEGEGVSRSNPDVKCIGGSEVCDDDGSGGQCPRVVDWKSLSGGDDDGSDQLHVENAGEKKFLAALLLLPRCKRVEGVAREVAVLAPVVAGRPQLTITPLS